MQERFSLEIDSISRDELYRYLGYNNQTLEESLVTLTDKIIEETLDLSQIRAVFKTGVLESNPLRLLGVELLGSGIKEHLEDSVSGAVFAVTLGMGVENRLRRYSLSEPQKALIMDSAASVLVESACERISEMFDVEMNARGLYTTERFSPGYSDLPLSLQRQILSALEASKNIGLTANDHNLLIPRKSVTAIIGVREYPRAYKSSRCKNCIKRGACKFGICSYQKR